MTKIERIYSNAASACIAAISAVASDLVGVGAFSDDDLLGVQRIITDARRALDASASIVAGEIAHRSRRELGYQGLAQREGFRTAEKLVQHNTGATARDAITLVTVGKLIRDADLGPDESSTCASEPWLALVGAAVRSGSLSVQSAQAIRTGLSTPNIDVLGDALAAQVEVLLAEASDLDADEVLVRARQLRDDLDAEGVAQREEQIREQRSIRRVRRVNGLNRYILDPDIETCAFLDDLYDRVTSPRRGNVTFLSNEDQAWADAASGRDRADERTIDQYVHDTITDLLRIAVATSATSATAARALIGTRQPAVRVLVTEDALATRTGVGHIEGIATPISVATIERIACTAGTIKVTFDQHANGIDLGREQRLFTARQRIILAARDGGCRMPGCDRPPGWCEAHHIDHWKRDGGPTNLDRGILLCRHHHMLVHNNGWEVSHDGSEYWLTPPATIDVEQKPRLLPSKSTALRDLNLRQRA